MSPGFKSANGPPTTKLCSYYIHHHTICWYFFGQRIIFPTFKPHCTKSISFRYLFAELMNDCWKQGHIKWYLEGVQCERWISLNLLQDEKVLLAFISLKMVPQGKSNLISRKYMAFYHLKFRRNFPINKTNLKFFYDFWAYVMQQQLKCNK